VNTVPPAPTLPTVLIVPGLRDHVKTHWQTWLAQQLPQAHTVPPLGREDVNCAKRVQAIEDAVAKLQAPVLIVAHSAGCLMVAHWCRSTAYAPRVRGALLAAPPDFEHPMPEGYPTLPELRAGGWLPVPRQTLPFASVVAISRNDPLASVAQARAMAEDWGSQTVDLGEVGHLNPQSGYGEWPMALQLITQLSRTGEP